MRLLLVDACGAAATLALADSEREPAVLAERVLAERSAAAALVPAAREMLAGAHTELSEVDAIAVVHGPGSFTGVRIGVSAAKGWSEGAGKPLIAISRLAVLAGRCAGERVHAVLDAGRGEFYCGSYARREGEMRREDEALLTRAELMRAVASAPGKVCVCEARVADALVDLNPEYVDEPTAADAFAMAKRAFEAGDFAEAATLDANYLRRADAEMLQKQRAARLAGRIRPAVSGDAAALAELGATAPEAAQWSAEDYGIMLRPESANEALRRWIYVLGEGREPQGMVVVKLVGTEAEIENLAVRPGARRQGAARALCAAAMEALIAAGARTVELEVRESNAAATGLYAKLGFERTGRRRDYYRNPPEDALLLRLELPPHVKRGESLIMEAHG